METHNYVIMPFNNIHYRLVWLAWEGTFVWVLISLCTGTALQIPINAHVMALNYKSSLMNYTGNSHDFINPHLWAEGYYNLCLCVYLSHWILLFI